MTKLVLGFDRNLMVQFYRRGLDAILQEEQFRAVYFGFAEVNYIIETAASSHFGDGRNMASSFWASPNPRQILEASLRIQENAGPAKEAVQWGEQTLIFLGLLTLGLTEEAEEVELLLTGSELYSIGSNTWPSARKDMRRVLRQVSQNFPTGL